MKEAKEAKHNENNGHVVTYLLKPTGAGEAMNCTLHVVTLWGCTVLVLLYWFSWIDMVMKTRFKIILSMIRWQWLIVFEWINQDMNQPKEVFWLRVAVSQTIYKNPWPTNLNSFGPLNSGLWKKEVHDLYRMPHAVDV